MNSAATRAGSALNRQGPGPQRLLTMSRPSITARLSDGSWPGSARNASIRASSSGDADEYGKSPARGCAQHIGPRCPDLRQQLEVLLRVRRQQVRVLGLAECAGDLDGFLQAEFGGLGDQPPGCRLVLGIRDRGPAAGRAAAAGVGVVALELGIDLRVTGPAGCGQPAQQQPAQLGVDRQAATSRCPPAGRPASQAGRARWRPSRAAAPRPAGDHCPARPPAAGQALGWPAAPCRRDLGRIGDQSRAAASNSLCSICNIATDGSLPMPAATMRDEGRHGQLGLAAPCPGPRSSRPCGPASRKLPMELVSVATDRVVEPDDGVAKVVVVEQDQVRLGDPSQRRYLGPGAGRCRSPPGGSGRGRRRPGRTGRSRCDADAASGARPGPPAAPRTFVNDPSGPTPKLRPQRVRARGLQPGSRPARQTHGPRKPPARASRSASVALPQPCSAK